MTRRTTNSTRTYTLCPYTALVRSRIVLVAAGGREQRGRRFGGLGIGAAFEQEARKPPVAGGAGHAQRGQAVVVERGHRRGRRSEEHTSELQSIMRISYAVFCLEKNII